MKKHDVFISYSSKESEHAYLVKDTLEKNGVRCWMAPESIPGGSDYTAEIPKAISAAKAVILIFSANAQNSQYVYGELKLAQQFKKAIIPFAIENCDITKEFDFILSRSQRIAAFEETSAALEDLVETTLKTIRRFHVKTRRRIIWITAAALAVIAAAVGGYLFYLQKTATVTGTTGDCTWSYNKVDHVLTVSGEGQMDNYTDDYTTLPWAQFLVDAKAIRVEDGVTAIGDHAFMYFISAEKVTIADSVTDIGDSAFIDSSFKQVTLSQNLEHIGSDSFRGCNLLEEIELPDTLLSVGNYAFSFCNALLTVHLPENLSYLGMGTFEYCENLRSAYIPRSIKTVPSSCFAYCRNLEGVTLSEGVEVIDYYCFESCDSLQDIELPSTLTKIGSDAFNSCTRLPNLTFPKDLVYIGENAFLNAGGSAGYFMGTETLSDHYGIGFRTNSEDEIVVKDGFTIYCYEGAKMTLYANYYGVDYRIVDANTTGD